MKEKLINFKTAKLAKEKGFDIPCNLKYFEDVNGDFEKATYKDSVHDHVKTIYNRPTQSLLQKWLREVHNIHINISDLHLSKGWRQQVYNMEKGHYKGAAAGFNYETYEKALEIGLQNALKLIK